MSVSLQPFRVAGFERLLVLGTSRRRSITIFSQQQRALALAHAAHVHLHASPPRTIAVVGAGIGGLCVARALSTTFPASSLHVLERRSQPLPLLLGCRTRWLHPTINLWPDPVHAAPPPMPFFAWPVGGDFAHALATGWLKEWDRFCRDRGHVNLHTGVGSVIPPQEHGGSVYLDVPGMGRAAFDLVVLAVGFGIESQFTGAEASPSYWAIDDLEQENPRSAVGRRRILISGVGDGGLIDFIRARVRDFDHRRTVNEFIHLAAHVGARLTALGVDPDPGRVARACRTAPSEPQEQRLNDWINHQLRADTDVTLLGQSVVPFATPSANLNRALVAMPIS